VACALPGLQLDLAATAPQLAGYGNAGFAITTGSATAQAHFNQGLRQAYAFNEAEAVRMFKAALAADPNCAMCAWGVAWQLGPNINATERGDMAQALRYADLAQRRATGGTAREQALIDAMALRYGQGAGTPLPAPMLADVCARPGGKAAHPLDIAYADRLHSLIERWPDDADLLSLWAEAEMVATRDDWWRDDGSAAGRLGELADRLAAALALQPEHTGLNHYLIHTVDASPRVHMAVAAADRLGTLAPASPHLVHMPSHIHVRVGRFADATAENQRALALDDSLATELKAQGFAVSKDWRGHNSQFAWFAALMEGRGDLAEGRNADAIATLTLALAAVKLADDAEPPLLGAGMRPALGDLQLRAGQPAAAEKTFRADLAVWPASGWALRGLQRALAAQGRTAEAAVVAADLTRQWASADPRLR